MFKCSPQPKLLLFVTVVTVVQRPASRKWQKTRVKPENTWGFPGIFGYYPHWTLEIQIVVGRGSLPGLPYCCSAGLTLATVVGEPHCCSVVTVNTSNTVQLLTFDNPNYYLWVRYSLSADCTLKATRSHTTFRVALPGAHPTRWHARPRAAGRHSPKRLSGLSGGVLRVLRRLGGPCERGGVVVS